MSECLFIGGSLDGLRMDVDVLKATVGVSKMTPQGHVFIGAPGESFRYTVLVFGGSVVSLMIGNGMSDADALGAMVDHYGGK